MSYFTALGLLLIEACTHNDLSSEETVDDSPLGNEDEPKSIELADSVEVPGQLDALIAGEYEGQKGCWAVSSTSGYYDVASQTSVLPADHIQFVTPAGILGSAVELPVGDQRSYGWGVPFQGGLALTYQSTAGWDGIQQGNHHGVYFWSPETTGDYNLYTSGLTRPSALVALDDGASLMVLFNNGGEVTDNGSVSGVVEDFFDPALVAFENPWGDSQQPDIVPLSSVAENASSLTVDADGNLIVGVAGGSVLYPDGGVLLRLDPNTYRVTQSSDLEGGLGIGRSALDKSGLIYLTGAQPQGLSLAAFDGAASRYFDLSSILNVTDDPQTSQTYVAAALPYFGKILLNVNRSEESQSGPLQGMTRSYLFDPESETIEEVGIPLASNFSTSFEQYVSEGEAQLCSGASWIDAPLDENGVPRSVVQFYRETSE